MKQFSTLHTAMINNGRAWLISGEPFQRFRQFASGEKNKISRKLHELRIEEVTARLTAALGDTLELPCDLTPPQDDAVALVLWYKDAATNPMYSLDARRGQLGQARHSAAGPMAPRVSLVTAPAPAFLLLRDLRLEDEGEFRCRVDFRKARSRNSVIVVTVVAKEELGENDDATVTQRLPSLREARTAAEKVLLFLEHSKRAISDDVNLSADLLRRVYAISEGEKIQVVITDFFKKM
ncbi:hypothetical protein LAZ67_8004051 [Cordylochernes scorpioides]|uniref:Ig-like domain-containing protein n=1 Tax=Cordylochernes scorpioides TaxID=51811 RepID=A0ABY6KS27_9ARAC|nr:hypothetical protein LAZ67_8004051 [Cordylochernes scorpioides]